MATPTREQMKQWAENYHKFWNAGDKEAWVRNWRSIGTGEFRMVDPVGTPQKQGFEQCCLNAFDLFQPKVKFKIHDDGMFICGNEVAWVLENHFTVDGHTTIILSIETYRFDPDGSVTIRTYYNVPERAEEGIGVVFSDYLPEDGSVPYSRLKKK